MSAEAELTTWQGRASGLLGLLGMHPWAAHGWRQLAAHLMRLDTPAVANRVPSLSNSREEMMLLDWRREGRGTSATSCSGQGRWGVVGEGEEGRENGVLFFRCALFFRCILFTKNMFEIS